MAANGCLKTFDRLFQRLKGQVLVSEVSFVKRKRSLSFETSRSFFASDKH